MRIMIPYSEIDTITEDEARMMGFVSRDEALEILKQEEIEAKAEYDALDHSLYDGIPF